LTKVAHFSSFDHAFNGVLVIPSQIDPLLLPFMTASNAPEEAAAMALLNAEQIEPIIRRGIGYKLRLYRPQGDQNLQRPEFEEIYNDIQLRLLKRLRALKQEPARKQIVNLRSYVATVTRNTCDEYLRHRYPLRRTLKDKVRHHLLSHSEFALWEGTEHNCLAGLFGWQSLDRALRDELATTGGELQERLQMEWQMVDVQRLQLHDLLTTIFEVACAPLDLDDLTALVAGFWGIEDHAPEPLSADRYVPLERQVGVDSSLATIIEQRQLLQRLWGEICQLPRRQRVALLLNLKNPHGINVITLLPATGVATFEQIARTLEIPAAEFEQLWVDLPLDDLHLAAYLGATRQQVINLRKTARERLLKRMSALS
jgi:DNA-directed RNA polymerase specialized sigma24 family protein